MLLWIFLAAVVLIALVVGHLVGNYEAYSAYGQRYFDWVSAAGSFVVSLIVGAVVFGIILIVVVSNNGHTIKYTDVEVYEWELMALGNNTQTEGRSYFLGGGYIGEKKVINFITKDHKDRGSIRVEQLDAHTVKIFEGSEKPHLLRTTTVGTMDWALPWEVSRVQHFDFHIPAGSVLESYSVDVNK